MKSLSEREKDEPRIGHSDNNRSRATVSTVNGFASCAWVNKANTITRAPQTRNRNSIPRKVTKILSTAILVVGRGANRMKSLVALDLLLEGNCLFLLVQRRPASKLAMGPRKASRWAVEI